MATAPAATAEKAPPKPKKAARVPSPLLKHFHFDHLTDELKAISKPIGELARRYDGTLPDGPEKDAMIHKLVEAKDWALRAHLSGAEKPKT